MILCMPHEIVHPTPPVGGGTWLVTGGAGYIGSHVIGALLADGFDAVVIDDLSSGRASRVSASVPLVVGSVLDTALVTKTLQDHEVVGVVHLAARKAVGESMERPLWYYRENVGGMMSLLDAMTQAGVTRLVHSSSAAVYGESELTQVDEDSPTSPISPYGETKLVCEWMVRDYGLATGCSWYGLRYFNVAGAGSPDLGDTAVANLIPLVLRAVESGRPAQIFGADYATADGTCIRDYVHVADLAVAHVAAARHLIKGPASEILNIGTGRGASVREVITALEHALGEPIPAVVTDRRPGDPPAYWAVPRRAEEVIGWRATRTLQDIADSAVAAWRYSKLSPGN